MPENFISNVLTYMVSILMVLVIISVTAFGIQMVDVGPYKQSVNTVLSREGGYTADAYSTIKSINKEYGNRYTIQLVDANGRVLKDGNNPYYSHIYKYGEPIRYEIKADILTLFLSNDNKFGSRSGVFKITLRGQTYSHSRDANV